MIVWMDRKAGPMHDERLNGMINAEKSTILNTKNISDVIIADTSSKYSDLKTGE